MMQGNAVLRGQLDNLVMQTQMVVSPKEALQGRLAHLLPEVCREFVHRMDSEDMEVLLGQHRVVYVSWTFRNDRRIKLHVEINDDRALHDDELCMTPICDFEEWQATAIMVCDAGEEVWSRPKPAPDHTQRFREAMAGQQASMQNSQGAQAVSPQANQSGSFGAGQSNALSAGGFSGVFGGK